jgi:hypothetical protein
MLYNSTRGMSPHEVHLYRNFTESYKAWEIANRAERPFSERETLFDLYCAARDAYFDFVTLGKYRPSAHG